MTEPFWNEERLAELKRLFCVEGKTTQEIGAILGCSKNAVIGKVTRLRFERDPDAPLNEWQRDTYERFARRALKREEKPLFPSPGGCVYPIGHPGQEGFHFCGSWVRSEGEPYCAKHHAVCYVSRYSGVR